jgi:hypothetical protein
LDETNNTIIATLDVFRKQTDIDKYFAIQLEKILLANLVLVVKVAMQQRYYVRQTKSLEIFYSKKD